MLSLVGLVDDPLASWACSTGMLSRPMPARSRGWRHQPPGYACRAGPGTPRPGRPRQWGWPITPAKIGLADHPHEDGAARSPPRQWGWPITPAKIGLADHPHDDGAGRSRPRQWGWPITPARLGLADHPREASSPEMPLARAAPSARQWEPVGPPRAPASGSRSGRSERRQVELVGDARRDEAKPPKTLRPTDSPRRATGAAPAAAGPGAPEDLRLRHGDAGDVRDVDAPVGRGVGDRDLQGE